MVRSGSTWSFNVALKLVQSCDPDRRVFGFFSETPGVLLAAARPRFSHLVIKSHALDSSAHHLCCEGAIKAIYTWRHPYDAIASCMGMFGSPVDYWIPSLRNALRIWTFHQATDSACIVPYEAIVRKPSACIEAIAAYLDLRIEPDQVSRIAAETSAETLKSISQHFDSIESSRLVRKGRSVYDRRTLLHQDHLRDGRIGHGASMLGHQQLQAIDAVLREEGFEFLCEPHGAALCHPG